MLNLIASREIHTPPVCSTLRFAQVDLPDPGIPHISHRRFCFINIHPILKIFFEEFDLVKSSTLNVIYFFFAKSAIQLLSMMRLAAGTFSPCERYPLITTTHTEERVVSGISLMLTH
jgi:hypothetical protein